MRSIHPPSEAPEMLYAARQAASGMSRYRWSIVGMLWFICFFNYADRLAIFSIFPVLKSQYHFTNSDLGYIGAAFTWVYAIGAPFAGQVGDRLPRKAVILGGLTIWSIITGLTAQCSRVWQFILVRGAEGFGETFYFPASMALISDYHTPATRSRAIGFHQTSIYAGTIFGGALAGWMGQRFGWQSPFWLLAAAGILLGLILKRFIVEPGRNAAERQESGNHRSQDSTASISIGSFLREFASTPTAVLLIGAYFGANLVGLVFLTWMPTFLKEKFGLNLALAGLGATFFIQTASMVGAAAGGILSDRVSARRLNGRITVQGWAALAGAPFIFLAGWTREPWLLVVSLSLFGFCKGVYDSNLTAAFYDVITPDRRSTATGIMNFVGWTGAGIGSLSIGLAVDRGVTMSAAISSTAVIYLIVSGILFASALLTAETDIVRYRSSADSKREPHASEA